MARVLIDDIDKIYPNGFHALHHISLEVKDGEFMVMVGPSGCGKTTALRMVAGLEDVTSGQIAIGDREVTDVEPKDRDIAMVFQNYALYPNMTVRGNIGFGLRLRRMPKDEIKQRVDEAARLLGLTEWLDRKPAQLSGGQRQRVAMGRAIVREPSVFLMDEPLSNLDAKLRVQMRAEVARIHRRLGVATLYVTHDQVEAMTMGDRVAVMSAGYMQQCDTPDVVYNRPANLFVAGFMGSPPMNLFEAQIASDLRSIQVGSQSLTLPESVLRDVPELKEYAGRDVVFGVRPEHFAAIGESDEAVALKGKVELVEVLGSEQLVHFSTDAHAVEVAAANDSDAAGLGGGTIRGGSVSVARVDIRLPFKEGEVVRFGADVDGLRFFDPETAEAIGATKAVRPVEMSTAASASGAAVGSQSVTGGQEA